MSNNIINYSYTLHLYVVSKMMECFTICMKTKTMINTHINYSVKIELKWHTIAIPTLALKWHTIAIRNCFCVEILEYNARKP